MNMLNEIFKDNTALLDEPEVKELIKYCSEVHDKNVKLAVKYKEFFDQVLEPMVYSEQMLIDGRSNKETVEKILQLTNGF